MGPAERIDFSRAAGSASVVEIIAPPAAGLAAGGLGDQSRQQGPSCCTPGRGGVLGRGDGGDGPAMGEHGEALSLGHRRSRLEKDRFASDALTRALPDALGDPARASETTGVVTLTPLGVGWGQRLLVQAFGLTAYSSTTPCDCSRCCSRRARGCSMRTPLPQRNSQLRRSQSSATVQRGRRSSTG